MGNRMSFRANRMSFRRNRRMREAASCKSDDTSKIVELMDKGHKIDATVLHTAAENGNLKVVKFALSRKPNLLNAKTKDGCTALHLALDKKRGEICNYLITNNAEVNAKDNLGQTPLHYLCKTAFDAVILSLLHGRGANLDAVMNDGRSALHLLAKKMDQEAELNQWKICEFLLSKNCQVNIIDAKGWTPLHYAADSGLFEVCRILLDNGADSNALAGKEKLTPLHLAVSKGYHDIAMLLSDNEANVDAQDSLKRTPLHYAAEGGFASIADFLVSTYNANPTLTDLKERSPLYEAVSNNKHLVVSCLLDSIKINNYHVDVNAKSLSRSKTALNRAAKLRNRILVQTLLDNGAYYNMVSSFPIPLTPWWGATIRNDKSIKELFACIDQMFKSARANNMEGVQVSVEKGAPVNARDHKSGRTALHFAVLAGNQQMTEFLFGKGAKVHLTSDDGLTPLTLALKNNKYGLARTLIEHATVTLNSTEMVRFLEAKSSDGQWTALHMATDSNLIIIGQMLIRLGAVYNAKDANGYEPAKYAKDKFIDFFEAIDNLFKYSNAGETVQLSELLEQYPTIVNARDVNDGTTALYWALHNNHTETAKLLLRFGANGRLNTDKGYTALHIACQRGNSDIIDDIMARCSSEDTHSFVDFRTFDQRMSALHLASNIEVARKLLSNGACYNIKNSKGETPHDVAKNRDVKTLLAKTERLLKKLQTRSPNVRERAENDNQDLEAIARATEDPTSHMMRLRMKFQDNVVELSRECSTSVNSFNDWRRHTLQNIKVRKPVTTKL